MVEIPFEGLADKLVGLIPYSRAKLWKNVLFHPDKTLASEKPNTSWKQGAKDIAVSSILSYGFMFALYGILYLALHSELLDNALPLRVLGSFALFAIFIAAQVVLWAVVVHSISFAAGIFGGKGRSSTYAGLSGLSLSGMNLSWFFLFIPLVLISWIPCIGALISLLPSLYGIFLVYKAVGWSFKISGIKAVISLFTGVIIAAIVISVLSFALLIVGVVVGGG